MLNESEASGVTWVSGLSARGHDLLTINASQPIPEEEWDPLQPQGLCLPDKVSPWEEQLWWATAGCAAASAASAGNDGGKKHHQSSFRHRWQFLLIPFPTEIPRGLAVNKRQCASRLAWKLARDVSHLATYRSVMHMTHIAAITLQWTCYGNTHPDKHQTNLQLNWRFSLLKWHPQPDVHQTSERNPCQPADSGRANRYENRRDSPPLSPSQTDGNGISGAAPIRPLLGLRLFSSALGLAAAHINFANHLEREENQFVFSFPKMTWRQPLQTKAQNYAVLPSNCLTFFFDF